MTPRQQSIRLGALALALALGAGAAQLWSAAFLRAARPICRERALADPDQTTAQIFLHNLFPPRAAGWEDRVAALSPADIWPHVADTLWSLDTALTVILPLAALLPACCTPLVTAHRVARIAALWLPFALALLLIPLPLNVVLSAPEACSLLPGLEQAVLWGLGQILVFTLPLLTFAAVFLRRWWRRRVPPPPGTD